MGQKLNVPHPVKLLASNTRGRDFIVADLHGCRHLLEARLRELGFDPTVDRLLSVGDLIDRGPLSFHTLRLIEEPWFEFVLGNHEAMLLTYLRKRFSDYHSPRDFIPNGGDWFERLTPEQLIHFENILLPILLKAPLVLHVDDALCPFNVIHAEAVGDNLSTMLHDSDLLDPASVSDVETTLTWGRRLVRGAKPHLDRDAQQGQLVIVEPAMEPGLSLTYVGHTILPHPVLHRSHLFMDCGGFTSEAGQGYLMLVEHKKVVESLRQAKVSF
jgi:serine/threonine protein phosphatase 1